MRILLSIKPEYVEQIERHTKLFEFRKRKFKNVPSEILIYASAPVKKIVGIIQVGAIIEDTPLSLWSRCKQNAGIQKKPFFEYFKDKNKGIAIVIKDYIKFETPIDPYKVNPDFTPPQSYANLDNIFPDGIEQHLPKND